MRTVALSVKDDPAVGLLSLTVGLSTTRSGAGAAPTVTVTASEQLLVVSRLTGYRVHAGAVIVGAGRGSGAVRLNDSSPISDASRRNTESVPTSVSPMVIVESVDW